MAAEGPASPAEVEARTLLDRCGRLTLQYGRPDLALRIDLARQRLTDHTTRVLIIGPAGHGRSAFHAALTAAVASDAAVSLIDGPAPVGSAADAGEAAAAAAILAADAVLHLVDIGSTRLDHLDPLRSMAATCPAVALVLTKIDRHPDWRRLADAVDDHLDRAGLAVATFPVSSLLRARTTSSHDQTPTDESGFRPLVRWLGRTVVDPQRRAALAQAVAEVVTVAERLRARSGADGLRTLTALQVDVDRAAVALSRS